MFEFIQLILIWLKPSNYIVNRNVERGSAWDIMGVSKAQQHNFGVFLAHLSHPCGWRAVLILYLFVERMLPSQTQSLIAEGFASCKL